MNLTSPPCAATFFFYMFLLIASFNLVNFTNVIAVDMPWEEPITLTSSFVTSLIIVLGVGLLCAVYLQFLVGSRVYKRLKRTIWGILFGFNAISCIVCTSIVYKFDLFHADAILLIIAALMSAFLTLQAFLKNKAHVESQIGNKQF